MTMRIDWFVAEGEGDEEHHEHLCITDGNLPLVGGTVYLHDKKLQQSCYLVQTAYHSLGQHEVNIDDIPIPDTLHTAETRLEFIEQWIEQHMGGVMNKLNPAMRSVEYAMQRGEVVLRRKPVGGK
jgi:hypothetical protein